MSDWFSDNQPCQTGLKVIGTIKRIPFSLGRNLKLYKIPDLTLSKDESIIMGKQIDQMLRELDKNK